MFKSIKCIKYIKTENNLQYYLYKIYDDDFEDEEEYTLGASSAESTVVVAAVINFYSSRNLNVAKNLLLFMRYYQDEHKYLIQKQINWYKLHIPEFEKYLPEIEKYLSLL